MDFETGAAKIREAGRDLTLSMRMTTDVRRKREVYISPDGERRVAVSGSSAEIRQDIDAYARAGLEYYCASIDHPAATEIIADLRRFSTEVMRSY